MSTEASIEIDHQGPSTDVPSCCSNILLGVTGSVAAVKIPELICQLLDKFGSNSNSNSSSSKTISIKVVLTQGGQHFWDKASVYDSVHWNRIQPLLEYQNRSEVLHKEDEAVTAKSKIQIYYSTDEWKVWDQMGDPVEHIVLRDWATICVIAPLSAHTLAKLSNGLCDDTLSCIIRAWKFGHNSAKPIILVPAMNVAMWEHPITLQQLQHIISFGTIPGTTCQSCVHIVPPQERMLACGEIGIGAMAQVSDIVETITRLLH